jgi:hypothetical protein
LVCHGSVMNASRRLISPAAQLSRWVTRVYCAESFLWVLLALGVVLRLRQYLSPRSLWLDEAFVALNLLEKSFLELTRPLTYAQAEPMGFVLLAKAACLAFGTGEFALRLFPLLSGVLALFLFLKLSRRLLPMTAVPIALGLFAISEPLITYSAEAKRYAVEVLATLVLFELTFYLCDQGLSLWRAIVLGVSGSVTLWFSYPSIFVLGGIGLSSIGFSVSQRAWSRVLYLFIAGLLWLASFLLCYLLSIRYYQYIIQYMMGDPYYTPATSSLLSQLKWPISTLLNIFQTTLGLRFPGIAFLVCVFGGIILRRQTLEKLCLLVSPIALVWVASVVHKYPFSSGRILLFLAPAFLLLIAAGAQSLIQTLWDKSRLIGFLAILLLFLHPLYLATYHFIVPYTKQELKPVIHYMTQHHENSDVIYIYYSTQYAAKYYFNQWHLNHLNAIIGVRSRGNLQKYTDDLDQLRGHKRVWLLFSHVYSDEQVNEERFFLYYLDRIGIRLDAFKADGASAYLYDLSRD